LVVLTDPETAHGFRLSGVEVVEAETAAEANKHLISLMNDDTSGIIAVNDNFLAAIDERTKEKIDKIYRPIVISIPVRQRLEEKELRYEYLKRIIRRAIGFEIKLGRG